MLKLLKGVLITFGLLLIIDAIYLFVMKSKFNTLVQNIQFTNINLKIYGAILCYLCIATIIHYFIIFKKESIKTAAILGMLVYGVFNFTNIAIFNNWGLMMTLMNIIWGGILFATVTYLIKKF
jgi:uncharacterized membrane protein